MILGLSKSSENVFVSENWTVLKDMVALRKEMLAFKVMWQITLGDCDVFISDWLRRLRWQDSQLPKDRVVCHRHINFL